MWLLNTTTYELHNFLPGQIPPYAILSHCWREGEVTFADIGELSIARRKHGWKKLENACRFALDSEAHSFAWLWIDTCCIDKSSSVELSEAITSMFAWYRDASHCFAYLDDVRAARGPPQCWPTLRGSRWFTRGWTLQELLAPNSTMMFVSDDWRSFGTREQLADVLQQITGIDEEVLQSSFVAKTMDPKMSFAKRMSWAAGRETTRPEDRAYSLMGIFDVSMPTTYGEGGERAFQRLQREIIKDSPDHSIFAWGPRMPAPPPWRGELLPPEFRIPSLNAGSLLAVSPDDFRGAADLETGPLEGLAEDLGVGQIRNPHHFETNYGIQMRLPLRLVCSVNGARLYCAALACRASGDGPSRCWVGLLLSRVADTDEYHCVEDSEIRGEGNAWQMKRVVEFREVPMPDGLEVAPTAHVHTGPVAPNTAAGLGPTVHTIGSNKFIFHWGFSPRTTDVVQRAASNWVGGVYDIHPFEVFGVVAAFNVLSRISSTSVRMRIERLQLGPRR